MAAGGRYIIRDGRRIRVDDAPADTAAEAEPAPDTIEPKPAVERGRRRKGK
jgi:hypothetical protein